MGCNTMNLISGWVEFLVIMDVLILGIESIANIPNRGALPARHLVLVLSSTSWVVGKRGAIKTFCIFCETSTLVLVEEHESPGQRRWITCLVKPQNLTKTSAGGTHPL